MRNLFAAGVMACALFATTSALAESNDWTIENKTTDYKFVFTRASIECASGDYMLTNAPIMPGEKRTVSMYRQESGSCFFTRSKWKIQVVAQRIRPAADPRQNEVALYPFVDPDYRIRDSSAVHLLEDTTYTPQRFGPIVWNAKLTGGSHPFQDGAATLTQDPTADGVDYENLAWGKPVKQSSECCGGNAERATDRNWNGNWNGGSVSATGEEAAPWWEVDLAGQFDIASIDIGNRSDCCADRLANFKIQVSPKPIDANTPVAATNTNLVKALYNIPINTRGRYVRITKTTPGILSLAEVRVVGIMNYARGKTVTQSSTAIGGEASRATDGIIDGVWSHNNVTHTFGGSESDPSKNDGARWLQVDLGSSMPIYSVRIHHRTDCCTVRSRLWVGDAAVPAGNEAWSGSEQQKQNYTYEASATSPAVETLYLDGVMGRYVRLGNADYQKPISITEIEVNTMAFAKSYGEYHVCLQTANGKNYVGQGLQAAATATACGPWESLTLVDINQGKLLAGDVVYLKTHDHRLISARDNHEVWARMPNQDSWETHSVWPISTAATYTPGAEIKVGDTIGIWSVNGWLVAENNGGSVIKVYKDVAPNGFKLVPAKY